MSEAIPWIIFFSMGIVPNIFGYLVYPLVQKEYGYDMAITIGILFAILYIFSSYWLFLHLGLRGKSK